jgi:hypothetical protein
MHIIALTIISIILITNWIINYIPVSHSKFKMTQKYEKYIEILNKVDSFKRDMETIKKIAVPAADLRKEAREKVNIYIGLLPIGLLLSFFIIYGSILWGVDTHFAHAKPVKLNFNKEYAQGVTFPFGLCIVISYTLLCLWFRLFQRNRKSGNIPIITL